MHTYKHVINNIVATNSDIGKYSCMNKMMFLHMLSNYLHITIASYIPRIIVMYNNILIKKYNFPSDEVNCVIITLEMFIVVSYIIGCKALRCQLKCLQR